MIFILHATYITTYWLYQPINVYSDNHFTLQKRIRMCYFKNYISVLSVCHALYDLLTYHDFRNNSDEALS